MTRETNQTEAVLVLANSCKIEIYGWTIVLFIKLLQLPGSLWQKAWGRAGWPEAKLLRQAHHLPWKPWAYDFFILSPTDPVTL